MTRKTPHCRWCRWCIRCRRIRACFWNHPALPGLPASETRQQITRTQQAITDACGHTPTLFRAPGGYFTPDTLAVCADLELRPVSWSLSSVDSGTRTAQRIGQTVLDGARTGAIVLHHDGVLSHSDIPEHEGAADRTPTVQALAHYLPRLLDAGYRFTTPDAYRAPQPGQLVRGGARPRPGGRSRGAW